MCARATIIDRKYFGLCYANIVRAKEFCSQASYTFIQTLSGTLYVCDPPLHVACVTLYSLALAQAQKWCMALNGSGEMRLDGEAERLSLLHYLDFELLCQSLACFAASATERLHQSLGRQRIGALGLVVELGPLLVRPFVGLERVQSGVLGLFELPAYHGHKVSGACLHHPLPLLLRTLRSSLCCCAAAASRWVAFKCSYSCSSFALACRRSPVPHPLPGVCLARCLSRPARLRFFFFVPLSIMVVVVVVVVAAAAMVAVVAAAVAAAMAVVVVVSAVFLMRNDDDDMAPGVRFD